MLFRSRPFTILQLGFKGFHRDLAWNDGEYEDYTNDVKELIDRLKSKQQVLSSDVKPFDAVTSRNNRNPNDPDFDLDTQKSDWDGQMTDTENLSWYLRKLKDKINNGRNGR